MPVVVIQILSRRLRAGNLCRMMNGHPIYAEGLVKNYGRVRALDGLDLQVEEGSLLALLGPNGAGKTTAVRIFTTLLKPDSGRALVAGFDVTREPDRIKSHIGLAGQSDVRLDPVRLPGHVESSHEGAPAVGLQQRREDAHCCGLARPVGT